jgi:5-methylcytosine-specific restriction endonuclease McrA
MKKSAMPLHDEQWLRNEIRKASIKWPGRRECLENARKRVLVGHTKLGKPKYKYHWQCAICKRWTKDEKMMEVDHIVEIGPFTGDWNEYLAKHFPRPVSEHLQALCQTCHLKKTRAFNAAHTKWKRKSEN